LNKQIFAVAILASAILSQLQVNESHADHEPAYVVPGRTDVPVMIDGRNAAWGVVEGDWGLYRPGAIAVTVIPAPHAAQRGWMKAAPYFPSFGVAPLAGRHEIVPPADRAKPQRAEPYDRSWFSASEPLPATDNESQVPMIVSPIIEPRMPLRR